ncbi:adenylyltransferase/cytidyltransferase family protein [Halarsenatibacter silvermanii]|uniref:RfaE bifunctional protein, domain II n=1 Tax=Halarsenatibacter silvermanii TaxID=321763 RepID=A0A1G9MLL2_9FIRM|nr:adenylyltransferase/cytidyltransferase family protein [Halarsenatibacter silvermanii]SDL75099.1 rfaE bifunctional protein, domain II [Halarsenatibacter silvermanii]
MSKDGIMELEILEDLIKSEYEDFTVGLTNGCFDIIHVGHTRYLTGAKKLADILVVALNSDESVARLKGAGRPIIPLEERMEIISTLEPVDFVTSFQEDTCRRTIELLRPDIYIKGGDYDRSNLPEWETVERIGGKVELLPVTAGRSTSQIIDKIISSHHTSK